MPSLRLISSCFLLATVAACGAPSKRSAKSQAPRAEERAVAKRDVRSSFGVKAPEKAPASASSEHATKGSLVTIREDALGKEFLLQTSMSSQSEGATSNGMRSVVVRFERKDGRIVMLESEEGNYTGTTYEPKLILATFDIVSSEGGEIAIDFDKGMSAIYQADEWYSSDFGGTLWKPKYQAIPVRNSYLEKVEFDGKNRFVITQFAQLDAPSNSVTVGMTYYLSPYAPNPTFKPYAQAQDLRTFGYFQANPILSRAGENIVHASKFDIDKGITFSISDNTPAELRQAVREGILYWNRAFGREVIKVIDAPADVRAPHPDYNVIQWIADDTAWGAYADAQMDPRTGENLHAQVFIFSGSVIWGRSDAIELLRRLDVKKATGARKPAISLRGLESTARCSHGLSPEFVASLRDLVASGATDGVIKEAMHDFMRWLVAHEIGHTLGLRHNFAGSLGASIPLTERNKAVASYRESGISPEGIQVSTSVMDYHLIEESALVGDAMERAGRNALSYDEKAIRNLYGIASYGKDEVPAFCSDFDTFKYVDCQRFDAGRSMAEWVDSSVVQDGEGAARLLLNHIIWRKTPDFGPAPSVAEMPLDVKERVRRNFDPVFGLFRLLSSDLDASLVNVRKFASLSTLIADDVRSEQSKTILAELEAFPKAREALFELPSADFVDKGVAALNALLDSPSIGSGTEGNGRSYELSTADKDFLRKNATRFITQYRDALVAEKLAVLSGGKSWTSELNEKYGFPVAGFTTFPKVDSSAMAAREIAELASEIVLATTGETIEVTVETPAEEPKDDSVDTPAADSQKEPVKTTLTLPKFAYPQGLRAAAAKLLASDRGAEFAWAYPEKRALKASFKKILDEAAGGDFTSITTSTLESDEAALWFESNVGLFYEM